MKALMLAVLVSMAGCSLISHHKSPPPPEHVVEVPKYIAYDCGTPPSIDAFDPISIEWRILPGPDGNQLFTLTPKEYENLGKNMASVLSSAKQLQAQRDFYAECIKRANEVANGNQ